MLPVSWGLQSSGAPVASDSGRRKEAKGAAAFLSWYRLGFLSFRDSASIDDVPPDTPFHRKYKLDMSASGEVRRSCAADTDFCELMALGMCSWDRVRMQ